ncbi:hypothetical protein L6164_006539 [Bauhinia variegata]|uniref:Uncharacterized protein n=1 Tax=Bauhinia variegata TaxID=167791 RepID=A0ACB9PU38_BAUVA|nr:hypothetical protein L6164_006539 [Bauhinia variegata]
MGVHDFCANGTWNLKLVHSRILGTGVKVAAAYQWLLCSDNSGPGNINWRKFWKILALEKVKLPGGSCFTMSPRATNIHAELDAVRVGLLVAWESGCRKVKVNADCMDLIHLLKGGKVGYHKHGALLCDILCMLSYRESNFCVDKLAKFAAREELNLIIMEDLPFGFIKLLLTEVSAVSFLRS